jgi:hypothetical protein
MLEARVTLSQPQSGLRQFVAQTGSGHHLILDTTFETVPDKTAVASAAAAP